MKSLCLRFRLQAQRASTQSEVLVRQGLFLTFAGAVLVSLGSALMFPNSWISFGVLHGIALMLVVVRRMAAAVVAAADTRFPMAAVSACSDCCWSAADIRLPAFSRTFKKLVGATPAEWRRRAADAA